MTSSKFRYLSIFVFFFILNSVSFAQDIEDPHAYLEWKQMESEHFFVNFHPGAEKTAKIIMKIAEEIFPAITDVYNYKPDTKISFIVKDYSDNSNGAAYYYDNKIEIWASSMDFDLRGTHNWLRNVITHEFTHMIQLQTAMKFGRRIPAFYLQWMNYESERRPDVLYGFPNVMVSYPIPGVIIPIWFAEGVAQYNNPDLQYDFWDSHRDMILRMYCLDGNMLSWGDMGVFGKTSLGNESSYNYGFSLVQYISETYGFDKVKEISYNMSKIHRISLDESLKNVLGKSGPELYDEWKAHLKKDYDFRIANVKKNVVEGEIIEKDGFGNLNPVFTPDGKKVVYISNKNFDYFSLSSVYIYDIETKKSELVFGPVRSELSISPDGNLIYYSRVDEPNTRDEIYYDIYVYDIKQKEEKRITTKKRAYSPVVSSDGKKIAFLSQIDGTVNLFIMDVDGKNIRKVTDFKSQEQLYAPKFSPDGQRIVMSYSEKDGRDIAVINEDGSGYKLVIETKDDERNPVFSKDGQSIIYSSDRTGVFNIYSYRLSDGKTSQLTNVLGGAFLPDMNKNGDLVYASYGSTGYKIALLKNAQPLNLTSNDYIKREERKRPVPYTGGKYSILNKYDDKEVKDYKTDTYNNIFGSMSFFPFLRIDNYNKNASGLDVLKPGVYMMSNEVLDKYGIFAGASINKKLERDLFLIFDYRDKLPLLSGLGINPHISLEVYNISRKTNSNITAGLNNIPVDVGYSMFEFDFSATHKIFNSNHVLKILFRYSMYTSHIGTFVMPETNQLYQAFSDDYLLGSDFGLDYNYRNIIHSKTSEINPVGYKFHFKLDYEKNRFNSTGEYEPADGFMKPKYDNFDFPRVEFKYFLGLPLPGWNHAFNFEFHGGSILGPDVDEFFNFYAGGFSGMKGYPFYGIGGNEFARVNLTYRFPISNNLDFKVFQIYFSKLYASVFADYGNAWTGKSSIKDFKKDIGVELRLETFSWYAYPTRIFLSGAYGLDSFSKEFYIGTDNKKSVSYGKEWRFYLGVLFGFDIFDIK